jgi:hypothetical protein
LAIAGRPGTDYPILSAVPYTNFYCDEQLYPGFFADMETRCQGEPSNAKSFIYLDSNQIISQIAYRFSFSIFFIFPFSDARFFQDGTIVVSSCLNASLFNLAYNRSNFRY